MVNIDKRPLYEFYQDCTRQISNNVILELKKMRDPMYLLSGEDSGLKNVWEEVCAQVQGEKSYFWESYEETIDNCVLLELKNLPDEIRGVLDYIARENFVDILDDEPQSVIADIVNQILQEAEEHTNERIRRYVENDFDDDFEEE